MRDLIINRIMQYTDNGKYPPIDGDGNDVDVSNLKSMSDNEIADIYELVVGFAG